MCLPFMKERAENLSGRILNSTPNAIIAVDDNLMIQQVNPAAAELFHLDDPLHMKGNYIGNLLDPAPFTKVMDEGENIIDEKAYLPMYGKYVEQSIIYDKEHNFVLALMRDITQQGNRQRKEQGAAHGDHRGHGPGDSKADAGGAGNRLPAGRDHGGDENSADKAEKYGFERRRINSLRLPWALWEGRITWIFSWKEGHTSLIKYGEELCGDCVESTYHDDKMTLVLADGLGSGVKANILSTLTAKIICTMMAEGLNMEECVSTIASTLPVCAERQIAYSTFTILQVGRDGNAYLAQFDNPETIFIRDGKVTPYEKTEKNLHGKLIYESRFTLQEDDMFLAMSDGVIHAGVGMLLNFGWQMEDVVNYVQENYRRDMSAKMMANTLVGACRDLYMDKAGDDTTVAVMRIRRCQIVNIMLGPPVDPKDDDKVVEEFLAQPGKKSSPAGPRPKWWQSIWVPRLPRTSITLTRRCRPSDTSRESTW